MVLERKQRLSIPKCCRTRYLPSVNEQCGTMLLECSDMAFHEHIALGHGTANSQMASFREDPKLVQTTQNVDYWNARNFSLRDRACQDYSSGKRSSHQLTMPGSSLASNVTFGSITGNQSVHVKTETSDTASRTLQQTRVWLENLRLWQQFCQLGNEMIITKTGRRLFPVLCFGISGLESSSRYKMSVNIVPYDNNRYKFVTASGWRVNGVATNQTGNKTMHHPDGIQAGWFWNRNGVVFKRLKLTNKREQEDGSNLIALNSMHKYFIELTISKFESYDDVNPTETVSVPFNETAFIAVTAYQHDEVTQLKIDNNPFAKAFRDSSSGESRSRPNTPPASFQSPLTDITCGGFDFNSNACHSLSEEFRTESASQLSSPSEEIFYHRMNTFANGCLPDNNYPRFSYIPTGFIDPTWVSESSMATGYDCGYQKESASVEAHQQFQHVDQQVYEEMRVRYGMCQQSQPSQQCFQQNYLHNEEMVPFYHSATSDSLEQAIYAYSNHHQSDILLESPMFEARTHATHSSRMISNQLQMAFTHEIH